MTERLKYCPDDILLDPLNHPTGTRLILTNTTAMFDRDVNLYEATVKEWSPSGNYVKLESRLYPNDYWIFPTHYVPIVVEVLETKALNNNPSVVNEFSGS